MDLSFTPAEQAFREEVRAFVREKLPSEIATRVHAGQPASRDDIVTWQRILHGRGWGAPTWPTEYGGTGWSPVQQHIFDEECAAAGAPLPAPVRPAAWSAPVIMRFGNAAQKAALPAAHPAGDDWWCQGYSEPGAGSDLASLKTRAGARRRPLRRQRPEDLDHARPSTPTGSSAWCAPTRRRKKQEGISFLLIDMKTPGITVRPIITLDGAHEVNEVCFDNVRVPAENLVGEENKGWTYAKFLLGHERTGIAGVGGSKRELQRLKGIAAQERKNGKPLLEDPLFRRADRAGRDRADGARDHASCACCRRSASAARRARRRRSSRSRAPRSSRRSPS